MDLIQYVYGNMFRLEFEKDLLIAPLFSNIPIVAEVRIPLLRIVISPFP